MIKKINT